MILENLHNDRRAVSPIISVAILVVITFVLGALFAPTLTGIVGDISNPPDADVSFDPDVVTDQDEESYNVSILVRQASNADELRVRVNGERAEASTDLEGEYVDDNLEAEAGAQVELNDDTLDSIELEPGDTIAVSAVVQPNDPVVVAEYEVPESV